MVNSIKENAQEDWHLLSAGKAEPDGSLSAEAHISAASLWFSGHFPSEPVLPGIALLAMVSDTIKRRQAEAGKKVIISKIRKVRFRLPVRPGSALELRLSCSDRDDIFFYQFKITLNGEMVCTGIIDAEPL
jgi:3-hydroxyacyl-[acyl-carrier-protein] dehydratase